MGAGDEAGDRLLPVIIFRRKQDLDFRREQSVCFRKRKQSLFQVIKAIIIKVSKIRFNDTQPINRRFAHRWPLSLQDRGPRQIFFRVCPHTL